MRTVRKRMAVVVLALAAAGGGAAALAPPDDVPPVTSAAAEPAPVPAAEPPSRPEAAVALDWAGPAAATARKPAEYTLTVRNLTAVPAQKTTVQVRAGAGVTVGDTVPAAKFVDGVLVWELGTLTPRAAVPLKLTLTPAARGELGCRAWVTFTSTSGMTVAVKEPQLEATVSAPETVVLGDKVKVTYTVKNTGDGPAEAVVPVLGLGEAVAHRKTAEPRTLAAGDSWSNTVEYPTNLGGEVWFTAGATGSNGLSAPAAATKVRVLVPKLEATLTGPSEVLVGRKARFTFKVKNVGDAPIEGFASRIELPAGWRKPDASDIPQLIELNFRRPDSVADGDTVAEKRMVLPPGGSFETWFDLIADRPGVVAPAADVTADRGVRAVATSRTVVTGIPALRMELADLADPVEKGDTTSYEIRVTNTGTATDENVAVTCPLPEQFKLVAAAGPTGHSVQDVGSNTVVKFNPVRELAPKTDAVFRITVRAAAAGDVRFKAQLTSRHLSTPVSKEESTRVYGE